MIELLSDVFRGASLVLLGTFCYAVLHFERRSFKKNLFLLFLISLMGFLLANWQQVQGRGILYHISFFLAIQLPLSFWLLSKSMFDDEFEWSGRFWLLLGLLPAAHYLLYQSFTLSDFGLSENFRFLPYLVSVSFVVLAIIESLRKKDDDLVLSRLKKRTIFVLFSALLALISLYFFFTKDPYQLPPTFDLIQNFLSCIFIIWFFGSQFSYQNLFSDSTGFSKMKSTKREKDSHKQLIGKMLPLFTEDGLFMQEGLTISKLADLVGEKEYLLRRAINGEMGYTNFNSFLNHYRIREACRLMVAAENPLTFQEIAYRMGYQSVATFNRAFKKETGLTPTEFRNQKNNLNSA